MDPKLKTVLVVDDEVEVAKALRRLLRREFNVELAHSGAEALKQLEQRRVDLVLSDFRMPGMNGAELLTEVKRRDPSAVRVMLSGYADFDSLLSAVTDGEVIRFLKKPWNDDEVLAIIRRLIVARDLAAALFQPFRVVPPGARAEIAQTDTTAQVTVRMAGAAFDRSLALQLIRKFLGAVNDTEVALVGGLLEQHSGRLSFIAEVGGEQSLSLEVPLKPLAQGHSGVPTGTGRSSC